MPAGPLPYLDKPAPEPKREPRTMQDLGIQPSTKPGTKPSAGFRNIVKVLNEATPAERDYWGRWYPNASAVVRQMSEKYDLPFETVAGVVAVMSPGNRWHQNVEVARQVILWWKARGQVGPNALPQYTRVGPPVRDDGAADEGLAEVLTPSFAPQDAPDVDEAEDPDQDEQRTAQLGRPYVFEPQKNQPEGLPATVFREKKPRTYPLGQHGPTPAGYPANTDKALKILDGAEPLSLMETSPKVSVFYKSLVDPESVQNELVLDGHAINIWRGQKKTLKGLESPTEAERAQMLADYKKAAERAGLPVQAVQAITWFIWKNVTDAAPEADTDAEAPTKTKTKTKTAETGLAMFGDLPVGARFILLADAASGVCKKTSETTAASIQRQQEANIPPTARVLRVGAGRTATNVGAPTYKDVLQHYETHNPVKNTGYDAPGANMAALIWEGPVDFDVYDPRLEDGGVTGYLDDPHELEVVRAYAERIKSGSPPPAIILSESSRGELRISDGSHRLEAARLAGLKTIPAYIGWRKKRTAADDQLPGGAADDMPVSDFAPGALEEGTKHELEHTDDAALASEIARDHLVEDPHYYEKLKKIEAAAGRDLMDVLIEAGPPNEWSGGVASALGDKRKDVEALWESLNASEQAEVAAKFRDKFDADWEAEFGEPREAQARPVREEPSTPPSWLEGAQRVTKEDAKVMLPMDGSVWLTNDGPWYYVPALPLSAVPRVKPWSPAKAQEYADLDPAELPPIVLEAKPANDGSDSWRYEIVDGEHRTYAARLAKLTAIPAYVGFPVEYQPRERAAEPRQADFITPVPAAVLMPKALEAADALGKWARGDRYAKDDADAAISEAVDATPAARKIDPGMPNSPLAWFMLQSGSGDVGVTGGQMLLGTGIPKFDVPPGPTGIVIYVDKAGVQKSTREQIAKRIVEILQHELIHVEQFSRSQGKLRKDDISTNSDRYYERPHEIEAYAHGIVQELLRTHPDADFRATDTLRSSIDYIRFDMRYGKNAPNPNPDVMNRLHRLIFEYAQDAKSARAPEQDVLPGSGARTAGRVWGYLREGDVAGRAPGIFLRIPRPLADQFPPTRGDDESPPHFTLAYVLGRRASDSDDTIVRGKSTDEKPDLPPLNDQDRRDMVAAVSAAIEGSEAFELTLGNGVDWFENGKGDQIAHKEPEKGSEGAAKLEQLATRIRDALGAEGFVVSYADKPFLAHSTLAYLPTREYDGPIPEGSFPVDHVELWGWPETWLFDLEGAHPQSKAAAPKTEEEVAQWGTSKEARAYHGTPGGFHVFEHDRSGLGTHFGTERAAEDRGDDLSRTRNFDTWEVREYELSVSNPLRLPDVIAWDGPHDVAEALANAGVISRDDVSRYEDYGSPPEVAQMWAKLRARIEAAGYDAVVYKNMEEGGGADSWIVWDNSKLQWMDVPAEQNDATAVTAAAEDAPAGRWAGAYPRFQRNAHGEYEEEQGSGAHPHADGAVPGVNEQVTNAPGSQYAELAKNWGTLTPGSKSDLRFYDYRPYAKQVDDLVRDHGYEVYYAGGQYGKPDLAKRNYQTGHLMVYDPTPGSGGDFGDEEYTRTWRTIHELSHAKSLDDLNAKYGEGRRIGKLGWQRTPREAKRAVEWEWLAAHKQRELGEQMGYFIDDATFNKEINTVLHDAVHRAITGQFTNPDQEGFVPSDRVVPLEVALAKIDEAAQALGLEGDDALLTPEQRQQLKQRTAAEADAAPMTLYAVVVGDALVAASADDDFAALQREAEAHDPRAPWEVYQLDNVPVDLARKLLSVTAGVGFGASLDSERALIEAQPYVGALVAARAMARRALKKWKLDRRRRRRAVHQVWYSDAHGFLRPTMSGAGDRPEAVELPTSLKVQTLSADQLVALALDRLRGELAEAARAEGYQAIRVGDRMILVEDPGEAPSLSDEGDGTDQ